MFIKSIASEAIERNEGNISFVAFKHRYAAVGGGTRAGCTPESASALVFNHTIYAHIFSS